MDLHKDFEDLCGLLNARSVKFLIVGGYAVAFHGAPRFTGDLDIFVQPAVEQVERTFAVFGVQAEVTTTHSVCRRSMSSQPTRSRVSSSLIVTPTALPASFWLGVIAVTPT